MFWRKLLFTRWSGPVGLLALTLPVALLAQPAMPAALPEDLLPGLKPLLEAGMKQSPAMISANIEIASEEALAYVDRSGLWPSVSGYGRYQYTTSAISSNTSSRTTANGPLYGISLSQPVFYWGSLKNQAEIGALRIKIADRQYADAYRLFVVSVRSQYLSLIQKKVSVRNQFDTLKFAESYLSLMEAKLRDGRISQGDVIAPRLQVDEARVTADKYREDYDQSRHLLAKVVGMQEIADDSIPSSIPKPTFSPETLGAYFEQTKQYGADKAVLLETYIDAIRQNELNYKVYKTRLYPKFNVAASLEQGNQTNFDATGRPILTATTTTLVYFGATWTIFDGFASRGYKLSALAARRLSEQRLKTFKETTVDNARALEKQIGFSGRMMDLTETRKALADDAVKKTENDVKSGVASPTALDNVAYIANTAELASVTARASFLSSWSEYVSVLGLDPALQTLPPRYLHNGK